MSEQTTIVLPIVAMRGMVFMPQSTVNFDIGRSKSIKAVEEAIINSSKIFLVAQTDVSLEEPTTDDLYSIGVTAKIRQIFRISPEMLRCIADVGDRGMITHFSDEQDFIIGEIKLLQTVAVTEIDDSILAFVRNAHILFEEYAALYHKIPPEAILEILSCESPGTLADLIGSHAGFKFGDKQALLQELIDFDRLSLASQLLSKEIAILKLQKEIYGKVKINIDKHQKDYFLREQIKVIQEEIGDKDGLGAEIKEYRRLVKEKLPGAAAERVEKELKRLEHITGYSPEASGIRDYIDHVLALPWYKKTKDRQSLKKAEEILNKEHYGLEKAKERIVEFLAARQAGPKLEAPVLCLVGSPGVGKTSIAKSVANAMNRKYIRVSLGGVRDEADIRGHRKTYIGSMPGRIISSMKQASVLNPVILLDEIDKMSSDFRGNPAAALLEVLDVEQNNSFRDHYLEIPYDLSDVFFICTANTVETIPPALLDRLEIIHLESYTEDDKLNISKQFLINKQFKKHGLKKNMCKITNDAILEIIRHYTKEAGVRKLEQHIGSLCRKVVKARIIDESPTQTVINAKNIESFLGKRKYNINKLNASPEVGIVRGLAWTSAGGDTLSVEVNIMKGNGKFALTGNMGEVMKESAQAAMSYIRSRHEEFELDKNFYRTSDIHIHIPEGAVPKDGPSAGITMATAMVSAFTQIPVRNDVGMTGEITIRGRVLPIGGLKEKTLAAKNAGLKKIILPVENEKDLAEISEYIKGGMEFVLVKNMNEVLEHSLVRN